jgi:hypothetical protein
VGASCFVQHSFHPAGECKADARLTEGVRAQRQRRAGFGGHPACELRVEEVWSPARRDPLGQSGASGYQ